MLKNFCDFISFCLLCLPCWIYFESIRNSNWKKINITFHVAKSNLRSNPLSWPSHREYYPTSNIKPFRCVLSTTKYWRTFSKPAVVWGWIQTAEAILLLYVSTPQLEIVYYSIVCSSIVQDSFTNRIRKYKLMVVKREIEAEIKPCVELRTYFYESFAYYIFV